MLLGYGAKVGLGNMRVKAENRMVTESSDYSEVYEFSFPDLRLCLLHFIRQTDHG